MSSRNPFVGPRPIQPGEPLHGRDREVLALYHRLQARRIVLLHSPSGAGKSSLVQAGLIPRLEDGQYDVWKPIRVNLDPGGLPGIPDGTNRYLLSAMVSLEDELPEDRRRSPAALAALDFADYLKSRPRRKGRVGRPVVLLFDQCEEVLTVAPRAVDAKRAFFAAVGRALDSEQYWALFIFREDYLGALAPYRDLVPTQLSNTFRLDLLSLRGAREAAVKLAEQGGRSFPAADQLVRDLSAVQVQQLDGTLVAEQGLHVEPVQLQVVCRRLWEGIPDDDRRIDAEDVAKYGEVSEALAGYYADAVARSAGGDPTVERAVRTWVGEKLIAGGLRSQVRQDAGQSAGLDNPIIQRLVDRYLVRTEQRAGATWFELSHDRLVEPIRTDNRAWKQKHLHPLQVQALLWEKERWPTRLLLGAEALPDAERWAKANPKLLTAEEREFLARSRKLRAKQQAARRQLVALATVAVMVAVVVAVLGGLAWVERDQARKAEHAAWTARVSAVWAQDQAQRATRMASAGERLARGQVGPAALLLAEMERPDQARGWDQFAIDVLNRRIPRFTVHHEGRVVAASWSPDGTRFATASDDNTARVWNADGTGEPVVLTGHRFAVHAVAWSPDGTRVATASDDNTVRIWNADGTGEPVVLTGHQFAVHAVAWSPDGTRVATASDDNTAQVWNADGSGQPVVLTGHDGAVNAASWSPDGTRIATASDDGTARVWNADGSGPPVVLTGHNGSVLSASWSPDGTRIATASSDRTARVWSAKGSGDPMVLNGHHGLVRSASWSPDGTQIATASDDKTARVWSAKRPGDPVVLSGHEGAVWSASWNPDGTQIVTVSSDNTARVWSRDGSGEPVVLNGHEDTVWSASWNRDGTQIVTASKDGTARVWSTTGSGEPVVLTGHDSAVLTAAWSPDGTRIVTTSLDKTAQAWSADGSGQPVVVNRHEQPVMGASWSRDGTQIVTFNPDHTARIWNAKNPGGPVVLKGHEDLITSASWSPDDKRIVTTSLDKTVRVWNADGSGEPVVLNGHGNTVNAAAWSPDGTRIATASDDGTAWVWNADGPDVPVVLSGHTDAVQSASWSRDGTRIVTASSDRTARVWNADGTGEPLVLKGHHDMVRSAAWSPDGTRIATASSDRTARVWNANGTGEPLVLSGHDGGLRSASWSPDGTRIATASDDATARVWLVSIRALRRALRNATLDCLSRAQRQTYLLESAPAADAAYQACECRHGRIPPRELRAQPGCPPTEIPSDAIDGSRQIASPL